MRRIHIFLFLLLMILISSCTNPDKSELKKEIKDEIISELRQKSMYVSKGDGTNFYAEPVSIGGYEHYIHHSTLNCPAINAGVQRNCYKINAYNNIFCHSCMDDQLITTFNSRFFPKGYK